MKCLVCDEPVAAGAERCGCGEDLREWQRLDAAVAGHTIEWHWVRGHTGHPENELADALANQAIDAMIARGGVTES